MGKIYLAWFATVGSIALFLFSCFAAASDAQGAILFIFTFPIMFLLLAFAVVTTRTNQSSKNSPFHASAYWTSRVTLTVTLVFLFCAFIPGLNRVSTALISGVSFAFQKVTGQTPYAWSRARSHISVKITEALKKTSEQEIDLRNVSASYQWDRVCVFGPYTSDEVASKVLQLSFDWKLSNNSKVETSDSVAALVFLFEGKNRGISYVVDMNRTQADFAKLSGQCFSKDKARFVKVSDGTRFDVKSD